MAQLVLLIAFPLFVALAAVAVDVGRMYLAKAELQASADAAARYAARGMQTSSTPLATAFVHASAVAAESKVDGAAPTVLASDVVRGTFNAQTRTFIPDGVGDAVCVTFRQTFNRPGSVPLIVSSLIGAQQKTIAATAVARVASLSQEIQPPASGNLWLSGMPDNTTTQNLRPDSPAVWDNSGTASTPKQRPLEINLASLNLHPGDAICLEGISGSASYSGSPDTSTNTADGDVSYMVANGTAPAGSVPTTSTNGISNVRAPIGGIMAVFLSDDAPDATAAPPNLDFGSSAQRDYQSISPQLKQVFYVGDGKRNSGELQTIIVPPGATRVFVGMMDAWQWNDNVGNFKTKLYSTSSIHLTK